ncbi:uncharacterized protein LOC115451132 isoform X2 [Manduca sexta]|uniref:uncharacterized protein LOC115451132 isoform X2 n=1 Tax=Manduca sexta TaxID=7130 RepID=UPI00188E784E|nr:uncharacterized protein LOC115451132 isoform X2 [Manduca sexta]
MQTSTMRRKASIAQLSYLAEYMKSHSEMASSISHSLQERANLETLWENLTAKLNSLGGPTRTVAKWKQTWRDLRNNVKRKGYHNKREYQGCGPGSTDNGPPTIKKVSQVDEQVLSITGSMAVHGMEEVACTEDFTFADQMTSTLAQPKIFVSSLPVLPEPSLQHAPSPIKKRRRIVKRQDSFDSKLLRIEEEKLRIKKEKNEILHRMVSVLEDIANKLK